MTSGPEHYREAERIARFAESLYTDTETCVRPRVEYASDEEHIAALEEEAETHNRVVREMAAHAQLAQVHATLALAAATAMSGHSDPWQVDFEQRHWRHVAASEPAHVDAHHPEETTDDRRAP